MESELESKRSVSWEYLIGCAVAAGLGSLCLIGAVSHCNRDKNNRFEEKHGQRIYLEGEDLAQQMNK